MMCVELERQTESVEENQKQHKTESVETRSRLTTPLSSRDEERGTQPATRMLTRTVVKMRLVEENRRVMKWLTESECSAEQSDNVFVEYLIVGERCSMMNREKRRFEL
ncbi:hypothetical protein BLNAU_22961 [Blattamonas nauphoetae]|uniref:Uncharacterized protein n=1 Tax=Blattamonas nauphoetae TaxID=2049346 RepID=A0ABQ9WS10_9EUKA|nr:hypothetical protein BLNAU_22961 [Blattamonas nauphoetae]